MQMDIGLWLVGLDEDHVDPRIVAVLSVSDTGSWRVQESVAAQCEIVQVVQGRFHYHVNGLHYIVSEGEMLLIPPGSLRSAASDPTVPSACTVVCAHYPGTDGKEKMPDGPEIARTGLDEELLRLYAELNLEWARRIPGFMLKCRALLLLLLHRYIALLVHGQLGGTRDPRIDRAVAYIIRHYSEPIRVADLSGLYGLNPVEFGTLFRSTTGLPVKSFVNHVRINSAETLIAGGFSIEEAAHRSGFDDVFYFSKVFKKLRGYPPSRTRPRA